MSALEEWKCYVCGSTVIRKYNAVQDDGRYVCENEHLLHEDALKAIAEQQATIERLKSEFRICPECGEEFYRKDQFELVQRAQQAERELGECRNYTGYRMYAEMRDQRDEARAECERLKKWLSERHTYYRKEYEATSSNFDRGCAEAYEDVIQEMEHRARTEEASS